MKTTQTYSGLEPQGSATSKSAISEISSLYQRRKKGSNIEMQVKFLKKPEVIFKCSDSIAWRIEFPRKTSGLYTKPNGRHTAVIDSYPLKVLW